MEADVSAVVGEKTVANYRTVGEHCEGKRTGEKHYLVYFHL